MKIFRWLFSNLILILLVVAVIYSYMFWGNLTGSDTPAGKAIAYLSSEFVEVEEFINAIKTRQQDKVQERQQAKQSDSENSEAVQAMAAQATASDAALDTQAAVAQAAAEAAKEEPAIAFKSDVKQQPPVTISYSQNESRVKQNSSGVLQRQDVKPEPATAAKPAKIPVPVNTASSAVVEEIVIVPEAVEQKAAGSNDTFISAEVEEQLDNVDRHGQVIDASKQNSDIRETWVTARKSYYQRDYALSEASYQIVIDGTEDNHDAYGELGNVYFNQGKKEQATAAYYEAASILVKKGKMDRARSLTGLLRHLDESKAEALQGLIDSAQSEKQI